MISLKQRFTINFSILFSVILAAVLTGVYFIYAHYRMNEFRLRLEEKAISDVKLMIELKQSEIKVLDVLSENSVHKIYNDKIRIFDQNKQLLYTNKGGVALTISENELKRLNTEGTFYMTEKEMVKYGLLYQSKGTKDYYILITAEDRYGHRQLLFLRYLLWGAFLAGTASVIVLARSLSGRILLPLRHFQEKITKISENRLHIRLEEKEDNDELDKLARAFNDMMDRINSSYKQQKEFTDNASHELRTPVTRIFMQVQNLIKHEHHSQKTLQYLNSILMDSNQIADTISSLLLLSRIESDRISTFFPSCRLDEVIFEAIESVTKNYPDLHTSFNVEGNSDLEVDLEIKADANLIKIVFLNLFKNAYLYSKEKIIQIDLIPGKDHLVLRILNDGEIIHLKDRNKLFQAFARGANAKNMPGTGLGLRITERILNYHKASIQYEALDERINCFTIEFPRQPA